MFSHISLSWLFFSLWCMYAWERFTHIHDTYFLALMRAINYTINDTTAWSCLLFSAWFVIGVSWWKHDMSLLQILLIIINNTKNGKNHCGAGSDITKAYIYMQSLFCLKTELWVDNLLGELFHYAKHSGRSVGIFHIVGNAMRQLINAYVLFLIMRIFMMQKGKNIPFLGNI